MDTFLWVLTAWFLWKMLTSLYYVDEEKRNKAKSWDSTTYALSALVMLLAAISTMIYGGAL